jgi:hypothetical protein
MIFFCYIDVTSQSDGENFIELYGLDDMSIYEISIVLTYYMITTLSTIGLGDLYPRTSKERIFISITILFGVAIFAIIKKIFENILLQFESLNNDFDEGESLSFFHTLLRRYNMDQELDTRFKERMWSYF